MYETTITQLKEANKNIDMKLPTIEESIKTYSTMAKNFEEEKAKLMIMKAENEAAIKMLEDSDDLK